MTKMSRNNNASQEVNDALMGMYSDKNAVILEVLLVNLGSDKKIAERLSKGDIAYASSVYKVVEKYVESYIGNISDNSILYAMLRKYSDWCNIPNKQLYGPASYELPKNLYERIIPKRIISLISDLDGALAFFNGYESMGQSYPEELEEEVIAKITNQKDLAALLAHCRDESMIMKRLTDTDILAEIALSDEKATWMHQGSSKGEMAVKKISDKATLVRIALLSKNEVISKRAKEKVGDENVIVEGIVDLLKSKKINERDIETHIDALDDHGATVALYNATQGRLLKQKIFSKLSETDRKTVREGNAAKCKQMIEAAKAKAKETFELGGFYLGMNISDVDMLVGYYFPDWSTKEGVDKEEKDIRIVYVPQQSRPFCRADKNGKVWQFNFGKSILKKFYKFDVQNEREWARAYSKEHGIDMKHVFLDKDTTVAAGASWTSGFATYKAWLHQDTWQWKNNANGYRLIYFAEPQIESGHGNVIKQQASYQFRFISSEAGTLRATIEND